MSNPQCLAGPPFSLSGNQLLPDRQVNFQFLFDSGADQATILAYEWYLNNLLVVGQNNPVLSANLDCGTYSIGGRILTEQGWSGIKDLAFQTCASPVSVVINGPDSVGEGASADYQVIGTYFNGTSSDLTDQYVLTAPEGSFTGHTFTTATNNTSNDTREVTITAAKGGIVATTRQVTITDATIAQPLKTGVLTVDLYQDASLNVIGLIDNPEVTENHVAAFTGNNIVPTTAPADALILSSDLIAQDVLKRRFEFNIIKLVTSYPATSEFTFYIKGRGAAFRDINGVFSIKSTDAVMALAGSPGSYIPSVNGGATIGNTQNFTAQVIPGANGSFAEDNLATLIKFIYHVSTDSLTYETPQEPRSFSSEHSQSFVKNNCGTDYIGSSVTYTVPVQAYSSTISQEEANNKALADIAANGQNYANAQGTCTPKTIEVNNFDFLAVRYHWDTGAGSDMDILVGFENNGTTYDNQYVGYGQPNATVPASTTPPSNAYLWWGLDNTGSSGYEGVLIGIKKFVEAFPNSPNIVEVVLYAVWFGQPATGNFSVELATYLGGSMSLDGTNFINTGGSVVSSNTVSLNTLIQSQAHSPATSYKVGVLKYDKSAQSATIQLM